jgi:hypothetical protein
LAHLIACSPVSCSILAFGQNGDVGN